MPVPMPTRVGAKLRFTSPYRGGVKEWSQLWHFTGADWTLTTFNNLTDALIAQLQGLLPPDTTIVGRVGYNPGSSVPVFDEGLALAGTSTATGSDRAPLEACALVRFGTTARSIKNHPIYLFKWFHAVYVVDPANAEKLLTGLRSNMQSNMTTILAGLSDGTTTRDYCGPFGAVAQDRLVEEYVHMREFPK